MSSLRTGPGGRPDEKSPPSTAPAARENVTGQEPQDPNAQLLLSHPGLYQFWDGMKWVVSDARLRIAAEKAGITVTPAEKLNPADVFEKEDMPYKHTPVPVLEGQPVDIVSPDYEWDPQYLVGMLGGGLLETLGCQVDDFEGTHEQVTSIPCGDNSCPICVVRIDPPEEIILDRDVVGSDLIDTITPALRDGKLTFQDKVAQRNIAATLTECTGIEQPRYFDARAMHPPDPAVRFSRIDLSKFPVDEIEKADPRQKQIWIFEDVYQGFAVVFDGTQRYVYSGNPKILAEAKRNGLLKDRPEDRSWGFAQSLRRFIGGISKSDYFSVALAPELSQRSSSETDRQIAYARSILEHPETVYLKSARTAGGTLVVRCSKEVDQPVLESDSVEVGKLLGTYLSKLEHYKSAAVAPVADNYKRSALKFSSVQGFLVEVLRDMTTPILEENIPVTRYRTKAGSEKAEFRMIFQLRELQGDLELVAHYAKSSLKEKRQNLAYAMFC